jgi:hypothetical protein
VLLGEVVGGEVHKVVLFLLCEELPPSSSLPLYPGTVAEVIVIDVGSFVKSSDALFALVILGGVPALELKGVAVADEDLKLGT